MPKIGLTAPNIGSEFPLGETKEPCKLDPDIAGTSRKRPSNLKTDLGTKHAAKVDRILASACRIYKEPDERAAMRGGMADAAALCDALVELILAENRGRGGKGPTTKHGQELAAVAKRCGDAIWEMRKRVEVRPALFLEGGV